MAKIQIKSETRKDLSFFPSSFEDYIPKDDKVRMIDSIVRSMDSKPLLSTYEGTGAPPYSPMMLLSLVIYSYINGVYSCRGIAVAYAMISVICGFVAVNANHIQRLTDFVLIIFSNVSITISTRWWLFW